MVRKEFGRAVTLLASSFLLNACAAEPSLTTVDSCSASTTISEIDTSTQTVQVSGGAAIGQHLNPTDDLLVSRVMFKATSSGVTSLILTFYENAPSSSQTVDSEPIASFNMPVSFSSGQLQPFWLTLPTPVQLRGGRNYLIGFAPNSPVNLLYGSSMYGSGIRSLFRTGSGSGGPAGGALWGSAVADKALSIGLEGSGNCR